ncbi:Di-sulfide bridge nucleocytoplasmic transport domain-containing protein [Zychaea mexicana]|uniref:Di-sulfide bridge nucleocytoplasmic transport domain-containing protein n=1 Tax=Zychaea mexicana TaxID=64656 RepID=UPI0022FE54AD|nr:Di-sulfide bridge nucleocytoplasmic transport domain-containing protein [Zychaea mexicana]KAI9498240.1 Di-sulfide bridge nucleocytoplasmic transport domain-containing protein [Zychaea mexicana]
MFYYFPLWSLTTPTPPPPPRPTLCPRLVYNLMHEPSGKRRKTSHPQPPEQTTSRSSILFSPHGPLIFSGYLKLLLHACGLLILLLAIGFIVSASHREIDGRVTQHIRDLEEEKMQCAQKYRENQCDLYAHQPFFGTFCNQWEQCMKRDLRGIGRAKITMTVYGELINALVEPLTVKAMLTICLLLFGIFVGSTLAF